MGSEEDGKACHDPVSGEVFNRDLGWGGHTSQAQGFLLGSMKRLVCARRSSLSMAARRTTKLPDGRECPSPQEGRGKV